jgi:hypothetical protein
MSFPAGIYKEEANIRKLGVAMAGGEYRDRAWPAVTLPHVKFMYSLVDIMMP